MPTLHYLVIHCTATPASKAVTADEIRRWHTAPPPAGRGWRQVGYTDLIHLDGTIERLVDNNEDNHVDPWEITNGAAGYNTRSRHIVYVGGIDHRGRPKDTRTVAQRQAMATYVQEFHARHPHVQIVGHNELSAKACPSFEVQTWLRQIGVSIGGKTRQPRHPALLLVGLLFLSTACGPSRSFVEAHSRAVIEAVEGIRFEFATQSHQTTTTQTQLDQDEEVETQTTEFDTTLPVDSLTGLAPVKRQTTQRRRHAARTAQTVLSETAAAASAVEQRQAASRTETAATSETSSRRGLNTAQGILCLIGLAALCAGLFWLARRLGVLR